MDQFSVTAENQDVIRVSLKGGLREYASEMLTAVLDVVGVARADLHRPTGKAAYIMADVSNGADVDTVLARLRTALRRMASTCAV